MAMPKILLENNRRWVEENLRQDPEFFTRLAGQQTPQYLWIGCSDSRVPANQITGLEPGEVFVHRNIANVVVHTDLNCLSVLQFAVDVLKVQHVIVCGHYGCSGVHAALNGTRVGLADNWLRHVQDISEQHEKYLGSVAKENRQDRLCELNVITQVQNVCRTSVVQDAWYRGQALTIHGWIYGLKNGLVTDLEVSCADGPVVSENVARATAQIVARNA
jgi:carbonic anhydrase